MHQQGVMYVVIEMKSIDADRDSVYSTYHCSLKVPMALDRGVS